MRRNLSLDYFTFKSQLEKEFYKKLKRLARRKKLRIDYESERLAYSVPRHYIPDFVISKSDGSKIYIEVKGYLRPSDRTKLIHVKSQNPEADIRLIFASDNKINSKSKTRYSTWAIKNGFEYAVGYIPQEWLE